MKQNPNQNQLLAALPEADFQRIAGHLELSRISQQAICNSHHLIFQRLCTWLLQRLDRCPDTETAITQDLIADALGVRREGINVATMKLQGLGFVGCRRGHIEVLSRAGLERLKCGCYGVVKKEFSRLLPYPAERQAIGALTG
jgi:hypothetical protein